jgi:hypothetical protein
MDDLSVEAAVILEEWRTVKGKLEYLFRERDQTNTKSFMEKGIDLFKQFLALTNDRTAPFENTIPYDRMAYKPVNLEERLGFIMARPNLYHSFRQLSELMVEQEKLYVKTRIKKSSRTNA